MNRLIQHKTPVSVPLGVLASVILSMFLLVSIGVRAAPRADKIFVPSVDPPDAAMSQPDDPNDSGLPYYSIDDKVLFYREGEASFYLDEYPARWGQLRPPLQRLGGKALTAPVHNCDGLAIALHGRPMTFALQQELFENYVTCFSVSVYGNAARSKKVLFDLEHPARDVYLHLDASSVPWSLGRRLDRKGAFRLTDVPVKDVHFETGRLDVTFADRLFIIWLNAAADFTGDGGQQIFAVWVETALKSHDYHEGLMLLTRERKDGPIVARPITLRRPPSFTPPPSRHPPAPAASAGDKP